MVELVSLDPKYLFQFSNLLFCQATSRIQMGIFFNTGTHSARSVLGRSGLKISLPQSSGVRTCCCQVGAQLAPGGLDDAGPFLPAGAFEGLETRSVAGPGLGK